MNWLPWRVRRALAWAKANRLAPIAILRGVFRPYRRRIMISTAFFGGVGGMEKRLKTTVESMPDCFFDIRAREVKTEGFIPRTSNYAVNRPLGNGASYDIYYYFAGGGRPPMEFGKYRFTKSILETSGSNVRPIEQHFDYIAIQTGNYANYCSQHEKCILAFPDIRATFPEGRKAVALPERFFLTVFNPLSDALKGNETLYRAADAASLPIVWCFSDKSGFDFSHLPDHPNIIKMKNLTQEELYYAYEHASAYVSFSRMEGLGWSIAEAFYVGLPIISREVGFLTHVKGQAGIHLYETEDELRDLLATQEYHRHPHDDMVFREYAFPAVVERILS
jgi:glycosyltransferase involved in cell wall biosynthesis